MALSKGTVSAKSTAVRRRRGKRVRRHIGSALLAIVVFMFFWRFRQEWSPDMRFWKAAGDAGFVLLWMVMIIGPLAKLWKPARRMLPWRRQLGVWFALAASLHALLIINGWARWSVSRFLGYEFIPQLGREARWEPGFGLANVLGLAALLVALLLAATSSDRALRALGAPAWRFLHNGAHFVFYVGSIHALYFLFIHYTLSFHKEVPDPDGFRFWFLAMVGVAVLLQIAAFAKMVRMSKDRGTAPA
ncbi:MAG: ferric reductase-like transmembrane domain-containing protein [Actinomycetota bacterium]|nr:ferric reductase-like transmembrane domain-containing protein [Actinomycetota bacterium]